MKTQGRRQSTNVEDQRGLGGKSRKDGLLTLSTIGQAVDRMATDLGIPAEQRIKGFDPDQMIAAGRKRVQEEIAERARIRKGIEDLLTFETPEGKKYVKRPAGFEPEWWDIRVDEFSNR